MKKPYYLTIIIFLLVFTLLSSFGSATISSTGRYLYYNMTDNMVSEWDTVTFTCTGVDFTGQGADFEATESDQCEHTADKTLITGLSNYTYCVKFKPESVSAAMYIWDEVDGSDHGIMSRIRDATGYKYNLKQNADNTDSTTGISAGTNYTACVTWNDVSNTGEMLINNVNESALDTQYTVNQDTNAVNIGCLRENAATRSGYYDGVIYEICIWSRSLTATELTEVYTYGCEGQAPAGDSTPPSITNVVRYPTNITVLNLANQHLLINATITDDIKLSKVNITMRLNNTAVYINGTQFNLNGTYKNTTNTGNVFKWDFDETYLLGATYPINFSIMETTDHNNLTLDNTNKMVKMKFFNVNNKVQNNFYEIYAENVTTGTTTYYYCNSSYTTGNPAVKSHCTSFFSSSTAIPFNHTHGGGKSKHRIVPMGINTTTGKIGNVLVTPESYIIKRVISGSERVYYITNIARTSQSQYSSNLGNTWSDTLVGSTGTIDAHIHSNMNGASINYRVCAEDSSYNDACSSWYSDFTDSFSLSPTGVNFYKPIYDGTYNETLTINHTASISPSGYTITNYTYSYAEENTSVFTQIGVSLSPITTYSWDISAIPNDRYYLKVVIRDSQRQSTTSYSDSFNIYNPPSLSEVLLQDILDETTSINSNVQLIYGVINMLPTILLWIVTTIGGLWLIMNMRLLSGIVVYGMSFAFDFILNAWYMATYQPLVSTSSFSGILYGLLMYMLVLWIMAKIVIGISIGMKFRKEV